MRPLSQFFKHVVVDIIAIVISIAFTSKIVLVEISYLSWFILALKVALIVGIVVILLNVLIYNNLFKEIILKKFKKFKCN